MDSFKQEISSSGKPYYRNKLTNKTQWGFNTYYNKRKRLPKGWVRLNLDGKHIYKFNEKVLNRSYSSYAPEDLLEMPYQQLLEQNDVNTNDEAGRRNNLFEQVARRLKVTPDSICDESLEFLAGKAKVSVQEIITYIEQTERKQLSGEPTLTAFSRIKRADINFSSQRSIRELCGLNMRLEESGRVFHQIEEQFTCILSLEMFKDPVICDSGHTFERENIMEWLKTKDGCPNTRIIITFIAPNYALRNAIDQFVEKYKNQKGEHWDPVVQECIAYERYPNRLKDTINIGAAAPRAGTSTLLGAATPTAGTRALVDVGFGADPRALVNVGFGAAPRAGTSTLLGAATPTAGTRASVGVGFGAAAPIESLDISAQEQIRLEAIRLQEISDHDEAEARWTGRSVEEIRRKREAKEQRKALERARRQEDIDGHHGSLRRVAARIRSIRSFRKP